MTKRRPLIYLLLFFISLGAFLFRYWTVDYDLPFIFHPDEPLPISIAQRMFKTGNYNPDFYHWPPLLIYIHMLSYWPYFWIGRWFEVFATPADILPPLQIAMGTTFSPMPSTVLMGRFISLLAGTGTVICAFFATHKLTKSDWSGLIAAAFVATAPTGVYFDRFIAPDTLATFLAMLTFVFAISLLREDKWRYYIFAGVFTGLAASAKYNAGLILLVVVFAHLLRTNWNWKEWFSPKLIGYGLITFAAFVASNPYAILDYSALLEGLSFNATHYATGHAGSEGDTFRWYIAYLNKTTGGIWILALATVVVGLFRPWRREALLAAFFPFMYFLFITRFIVRNGRTIMPLTPFLYVLAAIGLFYLISWINDRVELSRPRVLAQLSWFGVVLFLFTIPFSLSLEQTRARAVVDSRTTARIWIDEQLPTGSSIALESYSPFVSPEKFKVDGYPAIIDQSPEWYLENGYEYLIFGEAMYGRFFHNPELYGSQISQYEVFFDRFEEVRTFDDGGYGVKIYKIR